MSFELIKSPSQLKYEAEKIELELASLLKNWQKKKSDSLMKIQGYRTQIKELDAVLAETEQGYRAYQALLTPLSAIANHDPGKLDQTLKHLVLQHPALTEWLTNLLQAATDVNSVDPNTETGRVLRARDLHKNTTEHLRQKSRDLYAALKVEKQTVEDYATHLTSVILEKKTQFELLIKTDGLGL